MSDKLEKLVSELVTERTLSLEAVEQVKALVDENKDLKELIENKNIALNQHKQSLETANKELDNLAKIVSINNERVDNLVERELVCHKKEITNARLEGANKAYIECVGLVFRNPTVMKTRFEGFHSSTDVHGNYHNMPDGNVTATETVE